MIDYVYENNCVGCETCYGCGRNKEKVEVTKCDNCGEICYDGVFHEEGSSEDLCRTCVKAIIDEELKNIGDDEMFELMGYEEVK